MNSSALLVIDVQNDFCPGGALAVPEGDAIAPAVNQLAASFAHVILTQDWHPKGDTSFASSHPGRRPFESIEVSYGTQTLWPDHCVQGTQGAAFHPRLDVPHAELVLRKGFRSAIDSYSAFRENDRRTSTGLAGYLKERGFERVQVRGSRILRGRQRETERRDPFRIESWFHALQLQITANEQARARQEHRCKRELRS